MSKTWALKKALWGVRRERIVTSVSEAVSRAGGSLFSGLVARIPSPEAGDSDTQVSRQHGCRTSRHRCSASATSAGQGGAHACPCSPFGVVAVELYEAFLEIAQHPCSAVKTQTNPPTP